MLEAIVAKLATIGTPSLSDWLVQVPPSVEIGYPGDAQLNVPGPTERLFVSHRGTIPKPGEGDQTAHLCSAAFHVVCLSTRNVDSEKWVIRLKRDVCRAMLVNEGALQALFPYGMWLGPFLADDDMRRAGFTAGVQEFTGEFKMEHNAP